MIRPAHVKWHDAASSSGWFSEEEAKRYTPYIVDSYGWLLKRTSRALTIAQSRHVLRSGNVQYGETLDIPAGMVKAVRFLKGPGK